MILEGTNLDSHKTTKSEEEIEANLNQHLKAKHKGIVFVMLSSQNLDRLVSLYKASRNAGKTLVIDSYTAFVLDAMAKYGGFPHPSRDYPGIKVFFARKITTKLFNLGYEQKLYEFRQFKITKDEISKEKDSIVMIVRPNMQEHFENMDCLEGSSLIWSMWEGYLKEACSKNFLDFLRQKGMEEISIIHTSGHADLETLKRFAKAMNPKTIIPIHTMTPEKYTEIFPKVKMLEDRQEWKV